MIVTDEDFDNIVSSHKLIMIDFWAEWCRPCKMFSPVIEELSSETGIWLGKVNIDEQTKMAEQYGVTSIPTTILFVNGDPVKTVIGAKPKHVMLEELKEWI
jgi:thioredoxin 1